MGDRGERDVGASDPEWSERPDVSRNQGPLGNLDLGNKEGYLLKEGTVLNLRMPTQNGSVRPNIQN